MARVKKSMSELKKLMESSTPEELDFYCEEYDGFYHYMKMLEMLAQGCADGIFNDVLPQ